MKMFVGVTDRDWYNLLRHGNYEEVNFWSPSGNTRFKALEQNELFLFKLHSPENYIVGGGFFVNFSVLPIFLAWTAFGIKNGCRSLKELEQRVTKYRSKNHIQDGTFQIGCIILTEPFWFNEDQWIPVPTDWKASIVRGKGYSTDTEEGLRLFEEVQDRLQYNRQIAEGTSKYGLSLVKHRLGQGAFRVIVTDAYQRRCAITGEKTLPVLEAAHIRAYSENGPSTVQNGLLLRSDLHTLFDRGYITVDNDYRVNISKRLHDDFGNGKDYYKFNGQRLMFLPDKPKEQPHQEFLEWHNNNVYLG